MRILRRFHHTPQSYPPLPDLSTHPLWELWDTALELAIPRLVQATPGPWPSTLFFQSVYTSIASWLKSRPDTPVSPCFLPMLFRLFHVKEHTLSVFQLVCQYVDIGFFACDSAVAIGMIPLLLQSLGKGDYIPLAVFCFTKIISYDVGPLAAIIRDSTPTLLEELCHPDNDNKTASILFLLSRIFTDPNTFHHSEALLLTSTSPPCFAQTTRPSSSGPSST